MKNQWKPKNSIIIEEPEMAFDESLSEDHAFGLGENYENLRRIWNDPPSNTR